MKPWGSVRECLQFAAGLSSASRSDLWFCLPESVGGLPVPERLDGRQGSGGAAAGDGLDSRRRQRIGGASAPFYDGRHFAAAGVVLVGVGTAWVRLGTWPIPRCRPKRSRWMVGRPAATTV